MARGTKLPTLPLLDSGGPVGCRLRKAGWPMCRKCDDIDQRIARYRRISSQISDQLAQDGIAGLIEKLKAEKAALHSEATEK